ncbi:HD-GYP domain-containing protein [Lignipirellula cremea]|uniref:Cyclic di-GMP phosphodiesterase response regulator RpfG n=1 Tax=Lignipirellula cremea TaxID=2528010 RepID=A0A518DTG3_9BACT|nr:response regulator [Lignipirellula cremea]QDU95113.1 Cyclic di-GMP phosphodiesterase response regulator RpfG [Lignipirellula cremea]
MKILLVDDDDIALEILAGALKRSGYDVHTASNGREAFEILKEDNTRLVISDWQMPEMDGIELCQAVRRQDLSRYIYVILLTSHDSPQQKVEGLSAGADDFVTKPFNNAELIARVRAAERVLSLETREMVIFALAKLAESRDTDTGSHLERVQRYSRVLAQKLAEASCYSQVIDAEFVRLVYQTSPLHDIGKVGIPDSILLKPGRLTAQEFEVMKTHTTIGAETLDAALQQYPNTRFLQIARDIAASHHERFDGGGYPRGLRGDAIPLCGRIVAVADVYDALTSRRVYKDAFSHEKARDIIVGDRGSHFDPAIVDAFLQIEDDFITIRERFNHSEEINVPLIAL